MNKIICHCLVWSALLVNAPVFAENRAVSIDIGSIGVGGVDSAIRPARKIIGQAITSGTVDTFIVHSPRVGGPIPIEGGVSACAEAGFSASSKKFNAFIKQLRSIRPNSGIYVNVAPVSSCVENPPSDVCPMDVQLCPDGSFVGRTLPGCSFAPCPGDALQ